MALQFYLVAYQFSGVRGNLPVSTATRTGNLALPVHGNGVSLGLYYTGSWRQSKSWVAKLHYHHDIYCISYILKIIIVSKV